MPAKVSSTSHPPRFGELAAWLAMLATVAAILLLATLHVLSPEFSLSWRVIGEYAFGRYPSVLSLMFLSWVIGFPMAAVPLSVALGHNENWRTDCGGKGSHAPYHLFRAAGPSRGVPAQNSHSFSSGARR